MTLHPIKEQNRLPAAALELQRQRGRGVVERRFLRDRQEQPWRLAADFIEEGSQIGNGGHEIASQA